MDMETLLVRRKFRSHKLYRSIAVRIFSRISSQSWNNEKVNRNNFDTFKRNFSHSFSTITMEKKIVWEQERKLIQIFSFFSLLNFFSETGENLIKNVPQQTTNYLRMSLGWLNRGDLVIRCILHLAAGWNLKLRRQKCRFWVKSETRRKKLLKTWRPRKIDEFRMQTIGDQLTAWIRNLAQSTFSRFSPLISEREKHCMQLNLLNNYRFQSELDFPCVVWNAFACRSALQFTFFHNKSCPNDHKCQCEAHFFSFTIFLCSLKVKQKCATYNARLVTAR